MVIRQEAQYPVTWEQVAAFRLRRHHLSERAPAKALVAVAGDMTGAQAQLLSAAQLSLWSRVRDLRITDIEEALNERLLVKAACMRRTLFLVPSGQLAVFVRGCAGHLARELHELVVAIAAPSPDVALRVGLGNGSGVLPHLLFFNFRPKAQQGE